MPRHANAHRPGSHIPARQPHRTAAGVLALLLALPAACGGSDTDPDPPSAAPPPPPPPPGRAPPAPPPPPRPPPSVVPSTPPEAPPTACTPVLERVPTDAPDHVIGDGTPDSCPEDALHQAVSAGGIIVFDCGEDSTLIPITRALEPPIDRDTILDGDGRIVLDGGRGEGRRTRILHAHSPNYRTTEARVVLQGLTLQNAHAPAEDFTPQDAANPECAWGYRDGEGGAVRVRDIRLHVIDSVFIGNRAAEIGPDTGGGAIYALGALEVIVEGSTFIDNRGANGGAIGLLQSDGLFANSVFRDNRATGEGLNFGGASGCPNFNHAEQGGAGGNGGAIVIDGADVDRVSLCGVTIRDSRAGGLGTLFRTPNRQRGLTTLHRVLFDGNHAAAGGGALWMQDMDLRITASTFAHNSADGLGGGLRLDQGPHGSTLLLENSTVVGNVAHQSLGGGLVFSGEGHVRNVTFADNEAAGGEGFFGAAIVAHGDAFTSLRVDNTLFANNLDDHPWTPMTCSIRNPGNPGVLPGTGNVQWPRLRHGDAGVEDNPCTEGVTFADPGLGALGDHGGPTPTRLPAANGPAAGAGSGCPDEDQRGRPRPAEGCTAGAVERTDDD
ncbi:MAG: hypothetical protein EA398_10690 [Deltaproteobacteria bacterium]|nr:MAG: hypothetical protein EA398_10690 [Deltaproteobacteria bacterium]